MPREKRLSKANVGFEKRLDFSFRSAKIKEMPLRGCSKAKRGDVFSMRTEILALSVFLWDSDLRPDIAVN